MKSISKLKDDARRHEQREEWEKAIQVYLQVLHIGEEGEGEVDLPLYNRVGDLAVRLGRHRDAVRYYEQAADHYAEAGLYNNAIALCNKALRYGPDRLELLKKLGQFSASQGFLTDARRYFLDFAERKFTAGEVDDALSALEDFAAVADQADVRELVGRKLQAYGRTREAVAELQRAFALRQQAGEHQEAEKVRAEILAIDPSAVIDGRAAPPPASFELPAAATQSMPGYVIDDPAIAATDFEIQPPAETAPLEGLERAAAPADDAIDFSTIQLAGFESGSNVTGSGAGAGDVAGIEGLETTTLDFGMLSPDAVEDLGIEREPTAFDLPLLEDPADRSTLIDDDGAVGPLELPTLDEPDEDAFELPTLDEPAASLELPTLDEPDEDAFELPTLDEPEPSFELPPLDEPESSFELPTLAEPAASFEVPALDEAESSFELPALEEPESSFELPTPGEPQAAHEAPAPDEADTFELPALTQPEEAAFELPPIQEPEDAFALPEREEPPTAPADDLTFDLPHFGEETGEAEAFDLPPLEEPEDLTAAVSLPGPVADEDDGMTFDLPMLDEPGSDDMTFELPLLDEPPGGLPFDLPELDVTGPAEGQTPDAFALPDFEAAPADAEPVFPSFAEGLDDVFRPFGAPEAAEDEGAFDLPSLVGEEESADLAEPWLADPAASLHAEPALPDAVADDVDDGAPWSSADADAYGVADVEAAERSAESARAEMAQAWTPELSFTAEPPPVEPPAVEPPPAPAAPALPPAADEFIDLGALLSEDEEETTRFRVRETAPTGDEDRDFAELLSQFKAKVSEHIPPEEAGAHYDLGLAFKEMGLVDEAISEFQVALRAGHMRLKVYEELGHCFLLKEHYAIAEKVLRRALEMKFDDELELLGVYYHLGRAYEGMGRREQARDAYERVLGLDINFQDVTERLARL